MKKRHTKKHYSCYKDYHRIKRRKFFFKLIKNITKFFFPKNEFVWKCQKPKNETVIFVANHGKLYPPLTFLFDYNRKIKAWVHSYLVSFKDAKKLMFGKILKPRKPKILLYPLTFILLPLIVWAFRGFEPIPVYHGKNITKTFEKSAFTLEKGFDQVIFPERVNLDNIEMANEYLFKFNFGFINIAKIYYEKTGKCLKFYPSYVCQDLRKVVIGEPVQYNPDLPWQKQKQDICCYLENTIKYLADKLPEHKIVLGG